MELGQMLLSLKDMTARCPVLCGFSLGRLSQGSCGAPAQSLQGGMMGWPRAAVCQTSGSLPFTLGTQELLAPAVAGNDFTRWPQIAPPDLGLAPGHHGMVTSPHVVVLNTTTRPEEGPWPWL